VKIVHVIGARPNFMKVAPLVAALKDCNLSQSLIHTGQHYSKEMSDVFFEELEIPQPDINLEVGSGTHAVQTAEVMIRFERAIRDEKADLVVLYGDVNSTLAASLVCAKLLIPVAHVEAGLRSFDRAMPEEVNRVLTDQISSFLFTHSPEADANLLREGIRAEAIFRVGNVMIDTLCRLLPKARKPEGIQLPVRFALVTLHRPSNVDDDLHLKAILESLGQVGRMLPIIFPVHPRTSQRIAGLGLTSLKGIHFTEPLSYLEFLYLQMSAAAVITDSGGIQEETTFLRVPCLTIRDNTERPITVQMGSNTLVGGNPVVLKNRIEDVLEGRYKRGTIPPLWDGRAAERIAAILWNSKESMAAAPALSLPA
jgi:UDP-N-acetylglucosamine 2-epimerase (non-hydrolysing)